MNDTTADMEKRFASMIAARRPAERLEMASSMFDAGRTLLRSGLKRQNPALDEAQLRAHVFLRLYGADLSNSEISRIVANVPNMKLEAEG